ncbi:hypothetical protein LOTGIDRAFT_159078 [Lottia gigantea]|uniref:EB domain-containing protein n=1 Tax=Lottia gigantea TaxID=225164 RepID=V4AMA5_LOTGI|nr:hypothetical protein LOTGIDRAFT_159078 [Lottia gigantea]ESO98282.1 hypothetical protein LOTGIDRAFT_159078 [Lottia gigantea]
MVCTSVFLDTYLGGLLLDTCSGDDDCPVPATCRPNGCKGFNCLCPPLTIVDETLNFCQNASKIGSRCKNDTRCLSKMAICESNFCRCADFFRTTGTLQCSFRDERLIGENCSRSSECADAKSVCLGGSCVCAPGFREKTEDEYWTDPLSRIQCVSANFSSDYCGQERLVLPLEITPSAPGVTDIAVDITNADSEINHSEINIEASDAYFDNTFDILREDTVMPSDDLLPSVAFQTLSITLDILLPSEVQSDNVSDLDNLLITNSEIPRDPFTEIESDVIDGFTSNEPPEIEVTESSLFETMMVTSSFDSMFYYEDGVSRDTVKTDEVFEHTESDVIAPTETFTDSPSNLVDEFTRIDADTTSPSDLGKDTTGNNNTDGDKKQSRNSNVAITNEDVKIIISLLGSGVGILVVLTIIVVLFKLCRTGTTMSNTVSPEPQDTSSVLKSVNRQRTLFKDRW